MVQVISLGTDKLISHWYFFNGEARGDVPSLLIASGYQGHAISFVKSQDAVITYGR